MKVLGVRAEVPVEGTIEERLATIAGLQRGRVARRQLLAAGIGSSTIGWLVQRRRLIPRLRGVFAVGHVAPVELAAETEALLAVRGAAALSHLTAAAQWGVCAPGQVVEVVVSNRRSARLHGVTVHRSRILDRRDLRIRHGLPVTSPARTLLDVATTATDRELEVAFDRAIVDGILRPAHVTELLHRAAGHPGRGRLAAVLTRQAGGTTMTRSEAEERFLALIRSARLPAPELNAHLGPYEIDFLWRQQRFAIEVDGYRYHSQPAAFERDRRKDQDLRTMHIEPMRITWGQIVHDSDALIASVATQLARRER